jgi:hypothetical protein
VIHEIGHQTLEMILVLSAEQVAGVPNARQSQRRHTALRFASRMCPTGGLKGESEAASLATQNGRRGKNPGS